LCTASRVFPTATFWRLSNRTRPTNEGPGGIAEIDEHGRIVRSRSADDSSADQMTLRPYSLAVVPSLDRVVVALTYMTIPTWHPLRPSIEHDHAGNQVQVVSTLRSGPAEDDQAPGERSAERATRVAGRRTVLVNTGMCRLYQVTGLDGTDPGLELVHDEGQKGCAMPVVIGNYWGQANASTQRVFLTRRSDLKNVRVVSDIKFDERQRVHWLATDGSRIVVVNEPAPSAERRMWMLQIDRATGELALDNAFRDAGSTRPGIAFDRASWPHGATGTAVPTAPCSAGRAHSRR
jgi:hypothetical protein